MKAKSEPYLQVNPLTSQFAHLGFCSSPANVRLTQFDWCFHLHFLRLLRHVRQPVLTLCLSVGVGLRGMIEVYRA